MSTVYWYTPVAVLIFCVGIGAALDASIFAWRLRYRAPSEREVGLQTLFWTLGRPLFFFVENFYLFPEFGRGKMTETMQHGQEVAGALWLGVAGLLVTLMKRRGVQADS